MKTLRCILIASLGLAGSWVTNTFASDSEFNGLGAGLGNLYRVSKAQSRSISPENFTGEKGKGGMATEGTGKHSARELGQGWKVSPSVEIKAGSTFTLAEIKGPGCIQQIWMTPTGNWRRSILRCYWDGETEPSVECPVGRLLRLRLGQVLPDQLPGRLREPGQRLQLLLADALSQEGPHHHAERGPEGHDALLPGQLYPDVRAERCRILPAHAQIPP